MKKMMRLTVLSLVTLLSLSGLIGCSSNSAETTTSNKQETAKESTEKTTKTSKLRVELLDFGDLPASEGTIDNNRWTKYVKEEALKFGVDVEFLVVPRNQESDKINVLMASGSAPDLIMTYDRNLFLNYAKMGGLTDLTPYMDKEGANIKKYFGDEFLKYGQVDGKQFSIPARRASYATNGAFIRKDWLDQLKLPVPQTIEEFYNTLKAFKDNAEALGTKDVIPMGMIPLGGTYNGMNVALEAFAKTPTDEEIASVPIFLREGALDGLKFMNKLYHEGLLNKEFGLDSNGQKIKEQYANNQVGFVANHSSYPWLDLSISTLRSKAPEADYVAFPGVKNKSGEIVMQQGLEIGFYNMVPKTSKNPEAAVKYLDWFVNEGGSKLFYGFEGEHYEMKDGKMVVIDPAHNAKTLKLGGWLATVYNMTADKDPAKQRELLKNRITGKDGESYLAGIQTFEKAGKRQVVFNAVPDMQIKYGTALTKLTNDSLTQIMMATPDKVESQYKKFVDEYMSAGGKDVMDEAKRLYAEMKK
ncbi:hypothetical protein SY83_04850 [Paenibacillus swuensis]|uniref:ABC transporter substrate-binding protein n=1 Tax=Paenibacillus swuensis TaxID=1178515 RepID=A0A172TFB1_9BACL|nr:extracellular solute-binding protein [Paenibacillus swuensis]ANE45738.1 hypothetical protein SY83_04850 [Paenibacillus swuensis]